MCEKPKTVIMTIPYKPGNTQYSIVIETTNRYAVYQRLLQNKPFSVHELKIFNILDELQAEGVIIQYKSDVMTITDVWSDNEVNN